MSAWPVGPRNAGRAFPDAAAPANSNSGHGANGANGAAHRPAMVLIRPEQVELIPGTPEPAAPAADTGPGSTDPDGLTPDGLTGRITGYGYHGHDAVVTVQPERDPQAPPLTVRTLGGQALSPGSRVTLRAHGPVIAWPQHG